MLRLHADENVPQPAVILLQHAGHDVVRGTAGVADRNVIEEARRDGRALLTFDSDIGKLIFHDRVPPPPGVIFLRLPGLGLHQAVQRIVDVLSDERNWTRTFLVVQSDRIRSVPLPDSGDEA